MSAKKNRFPGGAIIIFSALAIFIAGCAPPGPRALLKGKKFLDRGDYPAAVEELKTATTLLPANAQAWNYYGVALQHDGQPADAATAYQRALALDRDLIEAHYNLGCLWLEQQKFDSAKTEFTAYTLRRVNTPEGWLKLGDAQWHAGDLVAAEKSFSTALSLDPNNAEALNGLGLARIQRDRPREAEEFFAAAVKYHPDYGPAILNLATVALEHLRDNKLALENYRKYLALTPHAANWNEVNALVNSLEKPAAVISASPPPQTQNKNSAANPQPSTNETRTQTPIFNRPQISERNQTPEPKMNPNPPPRVSKNTRTEVVKVQPEPVIATAPQKNSAAEIEPPPEETPKNHGFFHKLNPEHWFGSSTPKKKYDENDLTPLPTDSQNDRLAQSSAPDSSKPAAENSPGPTVSEKPIKIAEPAPQTFPRYLYLSPPKPESGDRVAASGAFTKARESEQNSQWTDAMEWYRRATESDPTWFEAEYNYGVLAYRLQNYPQSLTAYEKALAIRPDSVDARYNFALALKAAGYAVDAVNELKKIVASNPDEARAHLALGNLYAQQLHDNANARKQYLKVLALDPHNPQATDIRFWLSANPS